MPISEESIRFLEEHIPIPWKLKQSTDLLYPKHALLSFLQLLSPNSLAFISSIKDCVPSITAIT